MRDGTVLATDVYRPAAEGRYPVLLQRTPYNKETGGLSLVQTDTFRAVRQGYAVVIQDCRGRYRSDGDFNPFLQEIADGYDRRVVRQPVLVGRQRRHVRDILRRGNAVAGRIAAPPSLRAIAPAFTASDYYEGWTYQGGAFEWGFMCNWVLPFLTTGDLLRTNARQGVPDFDEWRQRLITAIDNLPETAKTLPLTDIPVNPAWTPYFAGGWLIPVATSSGRSAASRTATTRFARPAEHRRLVRHLPGWVAAQFTGVRESGATEEAREGAASCSAPGRTPPHRSQVGLGRFRRSGRAEPDAAQSRRRLGDSALLRLLVERDR